MPSVITQNIGAGIISQNTTIFDYPDTPATSPLSLQTSASQPLPADLATATGQLTPDQVLLAQLVNFPDSYDLSPGSHLMNFMQALLGPAGVGQYRNRNALAILQTALSSTNFYDLDSFYGAIFGALRGPSGSLPVNAATGSQVNPYTDLASADGWDEIAAIDAQFRERIIRLARAIALGGTIPGLQAMAEALSGVECDVYQVWALIEAQGPEGAGNTWSEVETAFPTWSSFAGQTWYDVEGAMSFGGMGINARNEIIVQPRKSYDLTSEAGLVQYGEDMYGIQRVLEVLKPAGTLLTVSAQGAEVDQEIPAGSFYSPDDFWSVSARVLPANPGNPAYEPVLQAYDPSGAPSSGTPVPVPAPALTGTEGGAWSYAPLITQVQALTTKNENYDDVLYAKDCENQVFPDGTMMTWNQGWSVISAAKATSSHAASAAVAAPYSGARVPVMTAG